MNSTKLFLNDLKHWTLEFFVQSLIPWSQACKLSKNCWSCLVGYLACDWTSWNHHNQCEPTNQSGYLTGWQAHGSRQAGRSHTNRTVAWQWLASLFRTSRASAILDFVLWLWSSQHSSLIRKKLCRLCILNFSFQN